jgi:hypothetical protein
MIVDRNVIELTMGDRRQLHQGTEEQTIQRLKDIRRMNWTGHGQDTIFAEQPQRTL